MGGGARKGVLLVNLGTPDAPTTSAVRRYLHEFLHDPHVIDIPAVARWLLVNLVILPTRPARSAAAYEKVWTAEGSPLLVNSVALTKKVAAQLQGEYEVALAMRYGRPSIAEGLAELKRRGVDALTVVPLYPQFAESSTTSSLEKVQALLQRDWPELREVKWVPPFYADAGYLDAFAASVKETLAKEPADHVLFSFHGLPERHVQRTDPTGAHCLKSDACCASLVAANAHCYRAQSYATARALAARLGLEERQYTVSFQSRLGRTPWIQPFTDLVIPQLAVAGVGRLAVVVPSFVADCLETLEEIGMRGRALFREAKGRELVLVPCINDRDDWSQSLVGLIRAGRPVDVAALGAAKG
jgi:ferrochelatase